MTIPLNEDEVKICVYASIAWISILGILLWGAFKDYVKMVKQRKQKI